MFYSPFGGYWLISSFWPCLIVLLGHLCTGFYLQTCYQSLCYIHRSRSAGSYGILWRRQRQPTPVLLPGKSHGWRSLVGCSPWGLEESDMTERLHFHFSLSCIWEGNGNPLQCSCLENPRDGGAWWAAIYGVAQSRPRLKWLSSMVFLCSACSEIAKLFHSTI